MSYNWQELPKRRKRLRLECCKRLRFDCLNFACCMSVLPVELPGWLHTFCSASALHILTLCRMFHSVLRNLRLRCLCVKLLLEMSD